MIMALALAVTLSKSDVAQLQFMLHEYDREIAALQDTQRAQARGPKIASAIAAMKADTARARALAAANAKLAEANRARELNVLRGALGPGRSDLPDFRGELARENAATLNAFRSAMGVRAQRALHARAQQLSENESTLAFKLARADASQRLALRLKLDDLHLDASTRRQLRARLDAIQAADREQVEALERSDAAILSAYRAELDADGAREMSAMTLQLDRKAAESASVFARVERAKTEASSVLDRANGVPYGFDFRVGTSIATSFDAAGAELRARFSQLEKTDAQSNAALQAEIATLQAARRRLAQTIASQVR